MKTLIVVRHAKSSWAASGTADHDRPLDKRGLKDAPHMAKRLHKRGIDIDLFLSSTALRARTTAQLFAEEYGAGKEAVVLEEKLYLAPAEIIHEVISTLRDEYQAVALFGHNPGITDFVNTLTPAPEADMPTCAIYAVTSDAHTWATFEDAVKERLFFDYPKNH